MPATGQPQVASGARSARHEFRVGILLVSIIPILAFISLTAVQAAGGVETWLWSTVAYVLMAALFVAGYVLLRRHPLGMTQLRQRIENVMHREMPEKAGLVRLGDDAAAIEKGMDLLVEELKMKVVTVKAQKERLEKQLFQARKMDSLSTMAVGVTHDFNNLLAAILGNADMVVRSLPADSPRMENAEEIKSAAMRAMDLTSKIMLYSGKSRAQREAVNLSALVREVSEFLTACVTKGIQVECRLDDDLPAMSGDPAHLRKLLTNLAINASEALDGSGVITLSTGVMDCDQAYLDNAYLDEGLPTGRYVYAEVSDTGIGMPPEVQSDVFDPFFTTRIRSKGLGLAVVMGVVRSHHGVVCMRSAPERGSTFRVLFPC